MFFSSLGRRVFVVGKETVVDQTFRTFAFYKVSQPIPHPILNLNNANNFCKKYEGTVHQFQVITVLTIVF
jgi:hypothetical protein